MIVADSAPPAIWCPAPLPSRDVMVWGDDSAMDAMRRNFETRGWHWVTMVLGEQTNALVLIPPAIVPDQVLCDLISDVNSGKFGKLHGGFSTVGSPAASPPERGR